MQQASHLQNHTMMVELLNGIPHGIALLDSSLCIVGMNRFLEAMIGYTSQEVKGVYGDFILRTSMASNDQVCRTVLESGESVSMEADLLSRNRSRIPVYCTVTRLHDEENQILALLVVLEDMSTRQGIGGDEAVHDLRSGLIGCSPQMNLVFEMMSVLARTDASVLITGETGTGKDKIAEQLHKISARERQPFVKVNCGALPEALLESELFGHVKGAFTGAVKDNAGMFRLADKGTIFLTEIGDLSLPLQVKLLSVLDDQEFYPVGSSNKVRVDVRVIAATHRPLREEVRHGRFREDLFYRLNVLHMHVPPLREREGDIRLLLDSFLKEFASGLGKEIKGFTPKAMELLDNYPYPGNIRELRNIIEYAANICQKDRVSLKDLPMYILKPIETVDPLRVGEGEKSFPSSPEPQLYGDNTSQKGWAEIEREQILEAMARVNGNRSKAAAILGCGRTTLWRKLKKYRLI